MIKPKYKFIISKKVVTAKEHLHEFSFVSFLKKRFNAATIYFVNPYMCCEYVCQYCAVSKEPYLTYDKQSDYYPMIQIRTNTAFTVKQMLPELKPDAVVYFSADGDPYQAAEKQYQLTRHSLELIAEVRMPVVIVTRNNLILRDLDLLKQISTKSGLTVTVPVVSADPKLINLIEPGGVVIDEKIKLIKTFKKNGVSTGMILWPLLPLINDTEKELSLLMSKAKKCNSDYFLFKELVLKGSQKTRFLSFLQDKFPYLTHRYQDIYSQSFVPSEKYITEFRNIFVPLCREFGFVCQLKNHGDTES